MRLGRPEQFRDKVSLRLDSIERAVAQYRLSSAALRTSFEHMLDEHTTSYLKGFGNEVSLLAAMRELFFPSRELLDVYLGRIAAATVSSGAQTARDFVPFFKRLLAGDYDTLCKPIFVFLRTNSTYIFHIRKFRNQLKSDPTSAEFRFNTDRFEMEMLIPVQSGDENILPHLDIENVSEAIANRRYRSVVNLDIYFPEMPQFWSSFQAAYQSSYPDTTASSLVENAPS